MTCIAACVHRGRVWLAAESLVNPGESGPLAYARSPKAWKVGEAVIGVVGDWAAVVRARDLEPQRTIEHYARAWRELLEDYDAEALIGFNGSIYYMPGPIEYADRIGAIGSGGGIALGALAASQLEGRGRVEQAVKIACRYDDGCGGRVVSICSG